MIFGFILNNKRSITIICIKSMFKNTAIFIITIFYTGITMSQSYEFGFNNYIEYQKGTLPIVLSVPHGGA